MGYTLSYDKIRLFDDETITINVVDDGAGLPGNVTFADATFGSFSVNPVAVGSSTTWTPGTAGNTNIGTTNDAGFSDPSQQPIAICSHATMYALSLTGPHHVGQADAVLVAAGSGTNAAFDGATTVNIADNLGGDNIGAITPPRYGNGGVNYTYTQIGNHTFTPTNTGGLTDGSPVNVTVTVPPSLAGSPLNCPFIN